jgi:hypothetical protein
VLYRGIAGRNFERSFQVADDVQVQGANLENGLRRLNLVRVMRVLSKAMNPPASDLFRDGCTKAIPNVPLLRNRIPRFSSTA